MSRTALELGWVSVVLMCRSKPSSERFGYGWAARSPFRGERSSSASAGREPRLAPERVWGPRSAGPTRSFSVLSARQSETVTFPVFRCCGPSLVKTVAPPLSLITNEIVSLPAREAVVDEGHGVRVAGHTVELRVAAERRRVADLREALRRWWPRSRCRLPVLTSNVPPSASASTVERRLDRTPCRSRTMPLPST